MITHSIDLVCALRGSINFYSKFFIILTIILVKFFFFYVGLRSVKSVYLWKMKNFFPVRKTINSHNSVKYKVFQIVIGAVRLALSAWRWVSI